MAHRSSSGSRFPRTGAGSSSTPTATATRTSGACRSTERAAGAALRGPGGRVQADLLARRKARRVSRGSERVGPGPVRGSSDGGRRTPIEVPTANNLAPRISPDGRARSLHGLGRPGRHHGSGRAPPRGRRGMGGSQPAVFSVPSHPNGGADWSPDGRWISYCRGNQLFLSTRTAKPSGACGSPRISRPSTAGGAKAACRLLFRPQDRWDLPDVRGASGRWFAARGGTFGGSHLPELPVRLQRAGDILYVTLADRQSDIWQADVLLR